MNAAVLGGIGLIAFIFAYRFYARFLSQKIFALKNNKATPAEEFKDGRDYVPTDKKILFGHHFSSVAGAAPIVGPAVAAIWGWVPAFLWVVFGTIFIGAAHDFGTLILSMKNKGQSLVQVAKNLLGPRVSRLLMIVILFLVWLVIAVFTLVIANLFISFPAAVIPVNFEIFVALAIGYFVNRKGHSILLPSILAQVGLFAMIYLGTLYPISFAELLGENQIYLWMGFLLLYSMISSLLPVWTLLQPRDFINSHQLMLGLGALILGLVIVQPTVVAPAFNPEPVGAPPWFPFIFITIACGAISGFHGLVSSGTSSKQVKKWTDAKAIGYGSALGEGTLALITTLAVTAGFSSMGAWHNHYIDWSAAVGLANAMEAFVLGASLFLSGLGINEAIGSTFIAVLVISFAATSLDTAVRIQRYLLTEIGEEYQVKPLRNPSFGSFLAVFSAFLLMMSASGGKGGLALWPLFGATNQMLASLSLIFLSIYLLKKNKTTLVYLIPMLIVSSVTTLGLALNISKFVNAGNYLLASLSTLLLALQVWIFIEAAIVFREQIANRKLKSDFVTDKN